MLDDVIAPRFSAFVRLSKTVFTLSLAFIMAALDSTATMIKKVTGSVFGMQRALEQLNRDKDKMQHDL